MTATSTQQYLIDASAHARILRPGVRERWEEDLEAGRVALCAPTEIEILRATRSAMELKRTAEHLSGLYASAPVPGGVWQELRDLRIAMAGNDRHRSVGIVPLLVAVTARHHGLTVLHYDHAFDIIAGHIGLGTAWLAEPGTFD